MNSREDLLRQLEDVLDMAGACPSRWPKDRRARLAAFVETDEVAARLFAEAKALDKVLACAPRTSGVSLCEKRILSACFGLPQQQAGGPASILAFRTTPQRKFRTPRISMQGPGRAFWGGAAMLAASLMLGVYIGASGEAVPTLRSIELLASNDMDAGIVFSGAVFEPTEFGESEPL